MELQSTDPWEVAYRELADETSSGLFPERRVFDVNVENWKVTYEESPDDLTVKQYLQMRLAAVVRLTSDLGPARVISTPSQTESRTEIDLYRHIAAIRRTTVAYYASSTPYANVRQGSKIHISDFTELTVNEGEVYRELARLGDVDRRSMLQVRVQRGVRVVTYDEDRRIVLPPGTSIEVERIVEPVLNEGITVAARLIVGYASQES